MIENPTTSRPGAAWTAAAVGLVLAAYALAFGPATYYAVLILLDPASETALLGVRSAADGLADALFWQAIAVTVAVLAMLVARRGLRLSAAELGLRGVAPGFPLGALGAVAAAYLAMQAGGFAEALTNLAFPGWVDALAAAQAGVPEAGGPASTGGWQAQLTEVVRGVGAAVSEELIVLALPIAVALRLGWSTPVLFVVLVVLRLPYHLWHGPAAVVLALVWSGVALWVYRRVGSVWPFVVAHVAGYLLAGAYPTWLKVTVGVVSVALVVTGLVAVVRARRACRR